MFTRVEQATLLHCGTVCGRGFREGTMVLAWLSAGFQSLPPLPTIKLGPSDADPQVGGFVYILGPCGSLQSSLPGGWEFLLLLQRPQVFTARGFEALFLRNGTLGCTVCLAPQFFLPVICTRMWDRPICQLLPGRESSLPNCPSPPLLQVWMNVSSLTPWLSNFCTV